MKVHHYNDRVKVTVKEKPKPCPFCGFDAEVVKVTYPTGRHGYEIHCMHEYKCYLFCATETAYWDSAEDAVRAWNQRET